MKAMVKLVEAIFSLSDSALPPVLRSCSECKLRKSCPYKEAFSAVMFEINPDFAFAKEAQELLAEECKYFIEKEPKERA